MNRIRVYMLIEGDTKNLDTYTASPRIISCNDLSTNIPVVKTYLTIYGCLSEVKVKLNRMKPITKYSLYEAIVKIDTLIYPDQYISKNAWYTGEVYCMDNVNFYKIDEFDLEFVRKFPDCNVKEFLFTNKNYTKDKNAIKSFNLFKEVEELPCVTDILQKVRFGNNEG